MSNRTEYLLDERGVLLQRIIQENPFAVRPSLLTALASNISAKIWLGDINGRPTALSVATKASYISTRLANLVFHTHFQATKGVLRPTYNSENGEAMELTWTPPPDMTLIFMIDATVHNPKAVWLAARDIKGILYRLPAPNLYADCTVCMGEAFTFGQPTGAVEKLEAAVQLLNRSKWNRDLIDQRESHSDAMFQWKLETTGEGEKRITQVPPPKNWPTHCQKVANSLFSHIAL